MSISVKSLVADLVDLDLSLPGTEAPDGRGVLTDLVFGMMKMKMKVVCGVSGALTLLCVSCSNCAEAVLRRALRSWSKSGPRHSAFEPRVRTPMLASP